VPEWRAAMIANASSRPLRHGARHERPQHVVTGERNAPWMSFLRLDARARFSTRLPVTPEGSPRHLYGAAGNLRKRGPGDATGEVAAGSPVPVAVHGVAG